MFRKIVEIVYNKLYEFDMSRYWHTQECGDKMLTRYESDPSTKECTNFFVKQVMKLNPRPKNALEVGFGYGRLLKALAESGMKFDELTGVDISSIQVDTARRFLGGGS